MEAAKPAQSRFSKMRQKLQLKPGVDEGGTQEAANVEKPAVPEVSQSQDPNVDVTGACGDADDSRSERELLKKKSEVWVGEGKKLADFILSRARLIKSTQQVKFLQPDISIT